MPALLLWDFPHIRFCISTWFFRNHVKIDIRKMIAKWLFLKYGDAEQTPRLSGRDGDAWDLDEEVNSNCTES